MPATAGHNVLLAYDWEDGFRNAPASDDKKPFGRNASLTTKEGSNNAVRMFEPGNPEATDIVEQNFDGSWTAEFTLSNPWFLRGVITESTATGTGPTTHTFDGFPGDPIRIFTGTQVPGGSDTYRALEGCVVQTATFTFNIPGTVDVSLEGAYANENEGASSFTQPATNERAMTHEDSQLNVDGTDLSFEQSVTVTINLNVDMVPELGSRKSVDYSPKQRNASITYSKIVEDNTQQQRFYGGASSIQDNVENTAPIWVEATNGKTGTDLNRIRLNLNGAFPDSISRSGIGAGDADLEDELNEMIQSIDAEAENGTASAR